jgi:streptogramin lyase
MAAASLLFAGAATAATLGGSCWPRPLVFPRDQAGHVFFGESEGDIGEISASGGISESWLAPASVGGVTTGPDGATWVAYISRTAPYANVRRIATDGTVTTFPVPPLPNGSTFEWPEDLVAAADGFLYARIVNEPYALRISTTGAMTYLKLPGTSRGIIRGPDGAPWFSASQLANEAVLKGIIGRLGSSGVTSQHSYVAETYGVPSSSTGFPSQLAVGADGRFWFTLQDTTKPDTYIGAMTPGGQFSFFKVASGRDDPMAITLGPDRDIWLLGSQMREVDTSGRVVAQHPQPASFTPVSGDVGLTTGSDGRVWFNDASYLYAMSPAGATTTAYPPTDAPVLCAPTGPYVVAGGPLSVSGRALDRLTSVTVGGTPAAFRAVSPIQIDLTIPAALPPGDTTLDATDGTTTSTLPGGLDIEGEPTITGLSRTCGTTAGGDDVFITGTELDATTSVTVGGKPATIESTREPNPTETTVRIVTPPHLAPATVDVRVTTIAGTSDVVPADRFKYSPACT